MSILDAKLEAQFADIFGGQPDNERRMESYLSKRVLSDGPYIMEYEAMGDTFFTSGATPQDALARTNDKEPGGWMFNNISNEREWFEGVGK